ncbi:CAP domain-containing protein [bacterium]|nr:CAP domain-containing protein [bacterium]
MRAASILLVISLAPSAFASGCGRLPDNVSDLTAPLGASAPSSSSVDDAHVSYALSLLNSARAEHGRRPLALDASLSVVALRHARDFAACSATHEPASCAHRDFFSGDTGGATRENQGFSGPGEIDEMFDVIQDGMMAEGPPPPGEGNHYSTILDEASTLVGIGEYWDSNRVLWVSEEFR